MERLHHRALSHETCKQCKQQQIGFCFVSTLQPHKIPDNGLCLLRQQWSLRCVQASFHEPCSIILPSLSRPYGKTVHQHSSNPCHHVHIDKVRLHNHSATNKHTLGQIQRLRTNFFAGAQANKTRHGLTCQCIVRFRGLMTVEVKQSPK